MNTSTEAVVLVHGLWMRGPDMWLLRWRLRRAGFITYQFSYPSTRRPLADVAQHLQQFIEREVTQRHVHFVAHSLGGLVVHRLLHYTNYDRPGRVVALGTPFQGSCIAQRMTRNTLLRRMLGDSYAGALEPTSRTWNVTNQLGVISGSRALGLGRVLGGVADVSDGTVGVDETRIPGETAHIVLRTSHSGILFNADVARQAAAFLRTSVFL